MVAQFHRAQEAFVAGAFALGVGPYAVGAAQVDVLAAVQVAGGFLGGEFAEQVGGMAQGLYCRHLRFKV